MTARSSHAYVVSALLHGAVVAAIFLLAYLANQAVMNSPKVFELVAGSGNDYAAKEAPALGVPGGIKVTVPEPPVPIPAVEPTPLDVAPPLPVTTAPPEPVPEPPAPATPVKPVQTVPVPTPKPAKVPAKKPETVPNFTKTVQRTAARKAARLEKAYKKQLEAEHRKQMSYDQYLKEHKVASGSSAADRRLAKLAAEGDRLGIAGSKGKTSGAGGKAQTREDGTLLEAYFALLRARSRENFVAPADVSDKLIAKVSFYLGADGSISRVRIESSSGNGAFDRAVLDAFRHTHSIGPRPDGRGEEVRLSFSMREEDAG